MAFLFLLACLLAGSTALMPDTQGKKFVVVFPRNVEISSSNCTLSITIINPNDAAVDAIISYYGTLFDYNSHHIETVSIPAGGLLEKVVPSFLAWEYMNGGFQEQFDTRVWVETSNLVNLYANNYNKNGYGDSFLVIPYETITSYSMAGSSYAFTLPAPAPAQNGANQYAIVYIIPKKTDVNVEIRVQRATDYTEKRLIKFAAGSSVNYFAVPYNTKAGNPRFFINGDADFLVVAAVTCVPLAGTKGQCDYAAFMPTAVRVPGTCSAWDADVHPTDLSTKTFLLAQNLPECSDYVSFRDGSGRNQSAAVPTDRDFFLIPEEFEKHGYFDSEETPMNPVRAQADSRGAFLTGLPSALQFTNITTYFMTRTENATLHVIANIQACATFLLDGKALSCAEEVIYMPVRGHIYKYYMFTAEVTSSSSPAVHKLEATPGRGVDDQYSFYVTGSQADGHAYGYYTAFNRIY